MNSFRLYVYNIIVLLIPPSRLYPLKSCLLRWAGAEVGTNVRIVSTARFHLSGQLKIGNNSYIGDYALILGGDAPVKIGCDVAIGPRVMLVTGSHELYSTPGIAAGIGYSQPILVGDGVWLCANCTVLGGVRIADSSIVAAGAVVIEDVEPHACVAGVPAKRIRER